MTGKGAVQQLARLFLQGLLESGDGGVEVSHSILYQRQNEEEMWVVPAGLSPLLNDSPAHKKKTLSASSGFSARPSRACFSAW